MGYRIPKYNRTSLKSADVIEGEPIEWKIERIMNNNEAITDGAPEIYTERKEGVKSAYNIRTDRWEVAAEAMDKIQAGVAAKREEKARKKEEAKAAKKEAKVVDINKGKDGGAESTTGTSDSK